jgi:3-hydroxyisobutyrate dehydrogenase-like beta-hydroxyacid dehydrogenase
MPLTVYNRTRSRTTELAAAGATVVDRPRDLIGPCEVIVTCLAGSEADEAVYLGSDGLLSGDVEGCTFVNLATVGPDAARRLASEVLRRGGGYVDSPLMGGNAAAVRCELVLAVAGAEVDVERARPVLESFSSRIRYIGDVGTPQTIKLLNNILYSITAVGLADVVCLGAAAGVDRDILEEMLRAGSARGYVMDVNLSAMLGGITSERGSLDTLAKDIGVALQTMAPLGGVGDVALATAGVLRAAVAEGLGHLDVPALCQAPRRARPEVRRAST